METQENSFVLLVRSLLEKGVENVDTSSLSDIMKEEFAVVGQRFLNNGSLKDAAGTFALVKNVEKLKEVGAVALGKKKFETAFLAYKYAQCSEGLVEVGNAFLGEGRLRDAYSAFKMSGDQQMISFFEENFKQGVDYYV